jgi:hypothetical protein
MGRPLVAGRSGISTDVSRLWALEVMSAIQRFATRGKQMAEQLELFEDEDQSGENSIPPLVLILDEQRRKEEREPRHRKS